MCVQSILVPPFANESLPSGKNHPQDELYDVNCVRQQFVCRCMHACICVFSEKSTKMQQSKNIHKILHKF